MFQLMLVKSLSDFVKSEQSRVEMLQQRSREEAVSLNVICF